ncbi:DNase I-like protein, partial [Trametes cingulata]
QQNTGLRVDVHKTKTRFTLATLNMRGLGPTAGTDGAGKWLLINQLMREKKIGLLAVQESHLDERMLESLRNLFGQHLDFYASFDPSNATGARGVAFVLNRRVLDPKDCKTEELVPGRAMLLSFRWKSDKVFRALNVYGPNDRTDSATFWDSLMRANLGRLDVMLGDLNVTEQPIDRLPARSDHDGAVAALSELLRAKALTDGWRNTYPNTRAFSYMQSSTGSQSRIDRIYVKRDTGWVYAGWELSEPGIPTDHKLALVSVANRNAPFTGKGRWTMPLHLLRDEAMKQEMLRAGEDLLRGIEGLAGRSEDLNPQTVYESFKKRLIGAARSRAKIKIPKLERRIQRLRQELERTLADDLVEDPVVQSEKLRSVALLQERISCLETKRFGWARERSAAKHWTHGETIGRYWVRSMVAP